ncbi:hypothetical protein HUU62_24210 [Rhodoferax sp. 4810]|nr:hypothetical protein [Rhodoferax jenense]
MQGDIVSSLILPLGLAFIMFGLGTGLTCADFERVFRYPRAFSIGVLCHFVLLPLVGYVVVTFFSITGAEQTIAFPYAQVMAQIFLVMGLPVALGMLVRATAPAWVTRWQPRLSLAGTILFVLIVIAAVAKNWIVFKLHGLALAPLVLTMNLMMMVLGFGLAVLVCAPMRQAATVAIQSSVQNGALAIVLASSLLGNNEMMLPSAVYSVVMYAGAIAFVFLMRHHLPPLSISEDAAAKAATH